MMNWIEGKEEKHGLIVCLGTHIIFVYEGRSKSGRTKTWQLRNKYDERIAWETRWRKYSFYPWPVYEQTCLREIAEFCEKMTKAHKDE